jgi:hypothetical protein
MWSGFNILLTFQKWVKGGGWVDGFSTFSARQLRARI